MVTGKVYKALCIVLGFCTLLVALSCHPSINLPAGLASPTAFAKALAVAQASQRCSRQAQDDIEEL